MEMYVIKHALTHGVIQRFTSAHHIRRRDDYIYVGETSSMQYRLLTDAFGTEHDARIAADRARTRRIASLENQIAKLKAMEFTVEDMAI